ncbi:hypothetical protein [Pseudoalteromonas neustonica]|uniref:hypothetical protein n=1 Tax=Pseudoalteromonas neustonica TaxID=1840331 RepID=UPI0007DB3D11|nr:hypothetical protein [Pseudoalteromonas neustonica]
MRTILAFSFILASFSSIASMDIHMLVPTKLTYQELFDLGIKRVIVESENGKNNWAIIVYPVKDDKGETLSEVAVTMQLDDREMLMTVTKSDELPNNRFMRSDIAFVNENNLVVQVNISYGGRDLIIPNVMELKTINYSEYELQYNKPLKQDK